MKFVIFKKELFWIFVRKYSFVSEGNFNTKRQPPKNFWGRHAGPWDGVRRLFGLCFPCWSFTGEIQKGTGGRGRDRKCHKLS